MKYFFKNILLFQFFITILLSQEKGMENFVGYNCYGSSGGLTLSTPGILTVGNVSLNATYQDYFSDRTVKNGLYKTVAFGVTHSSEAYLSFLSLTKKNFDENNSIGGIKYNLVGYNKHLGIAASADIRFYHFENNDTLQNADNGYYILPSLIIGSERIGNHYFYGMFGYRIRFNENSSSSDNLFLGLGMTYSMTENFLLLGEISHNEYSLHSSGFKNAFGIKWNIIDNIQITGGLQMLYERSELSTGAFFSLSIATSIFPSMKPPVENNQSNYIPPPLPAMENPNDVDSDDDGLTDREEIEIYKTDPHNPDTDGDKLTDGLEVLRYKTDPLNKDTDGDGVTDGDEVLIYKTNPLKKDTDDDSLSDGDEIFIYHTNPLVADTDSGGVSDGDEILFGTNPLDKSDDETIYQLPLQKNIVVGSLHSDNVFTRTLELKRLFIAMRRNMNMIVDIFIYDPLIQKNNPSMKMNIIQDVFFREQIDSNRFTVKIIEKQYTSEDNNNIPTFQDAAVVAFRRQ